MTAAPILPERHEWTVDERPWKVSVDLPALTARKNDLLAPDEE
ncbi:hypothetical protein AB0C42_21210 [Micromonospora taraxaci]